MSESLIFVVAANQRYKILAESCIASVRKQGYECLVFDLGDLGQGIPYKVLEPEFHKSGTYPTAFKKWRSRGMHTPGLLARCLPLAPCWDSLVVYLDADTLLLDRIDEIAEVDFGLGVTVRPEKEHESLGRVNSGVMFFRPKKLGSLFLTQWQEASEAIGSNQEGLNQWLAWQTIYQVAEFPTNVYNNYHTPQNPPQGTKIVHFRASLYDHIWQGV